MNPIALLSDIFQVLEVVSFIGLLVLVWRVSRHPRRRFRAIIYGWAALFLWALFWTIILPLCGMNLPIATFPDGADAMLFTVMGWVYPAVIVGVRLAWERRRKGKP